MQLPKIQVTHYFNLCKSCVLSHFRQPDTDLCASKASPSSAVVPQLNSCHIFQRKGFQAHRHFCSWQFFKHGIVRESVTSSSIFWTIRKEGRPVRGTANKLWEERRNLLTLQKTKFSYLSTSWYLRQRHDQWSLSNWLWWGSSTGNWWLLQLVLSCLLGRS